MFRPDPNALGSAPAGLDAASLAVGERRWRWALLLALPDVPLTVAIMLALYALLRAMAQNHLWRWLLLGFALAICWMAHYRAAMPMLAELLWCMLTPRGWAQWRHAGLWLAMFAAALSLLPLIISNLQQRGAGGRVPTD